MIFNIFKSKPSLKELIPDGFVDIHSHILPGIDDGAKNIEESIGLINNMKEMGFTKIIGTPHVYPGLYNNTNETIKKSYELLTNRINNKTCIDYASEYIIDESLIYKAREKSLLCIKDNCVLVEMSYLNAPNNLYEILFELQTNGYKIILAHPERYRFLHNNFKEYDKLKKIGCMFQINLLSATEYYGKDIIKCLDKLLLKNYVDFVGSDIHSIKHINLMKNKIKLKSEKQFKEAIERNLQFL